MSKRAILAIDQGTTGSTALLFDRTGRSLGRCSVEFPQLYPQPGWVEHDTRAIWASVEQAVRGALAAAQLDGSDVAAIGLTNQRETTVVWDRQSGEAVRPAIVWQCRRTAPAVDQLKRDGVAATVQAHTGLLLDAYFSGTKIAWTLEHIERGYERAERGELAFGTIDSFLVYRLSGGARHVTDVTNASRTLLMHIERCAWDDEMLQLFKVPAAMLPEIVPSAGVVAETRGLGFLPDGIPIAGLAGDQQAALFGQGCFAPGEAKCTYGTGAFVLVNLGEQLRLSPHGLVTTVAWQLQGQKPVYAQEGSAFVAGAIVQWLRDGLGLVKSAAEVEALAASVPSSDGVVLVPALAGLGAPYWDQEARGLLCGLTRGTTGAHIARAALEGIACEVQDLLQACDVKLSRLRVDGGAAGNDLLMQMQADLSQLVVERPRELESTGRGAAMLAGLAIGFLEPAASADAMELERRFEPQLSDVERSKALKRWHDAVARTRGAV